MQFISIFLCVAIVCLYIVWQSAWVDAEQQLPARAPLRAGQTLPAGHPRPQGWLSFLPKEDFHHFIQGNPLGSDVLQLFSEVNGTRKLLDFMLDNLAVSTSHPQSRQIFKPNIFFPRKKFKQIFNVHGSGPGSSFNPWTGRTLPPFSQSCATMFFVTGGAKFHSSFFIFLLTSTQTNLPRYATRSLYGYCPQWALNWEYR